MAPLEPASSDLIRLSHRSWTKRLFDMNPAVRFDVFVHSWSPEVGPLFHELYGEMLIEAVHEPTRYENNRTHQLAFKCLVPQANCQRTISQIMSLGKAVRLKAEHEMSSAFAYDAAIVGRHDVEIHPSGWRLSAAFLAGGAGEVWFAGTCSQPCSQTVRVKSFPNDCRVHEKRCARPLPEREKQQPMLGSHWNTPMA
jgi:hypothetical protein